VCQCFTSYRWYLLLKFEKCSWIIQHSLKSGGTNDHFRQVNVAGTAPHWNACCPNLHIKLPLFYFYYWTKLTCSLLLDFSDACTKSKLWLSKCVTSHCVFYGFSMLDFSCSYKIRGVTHTFKMCHKTLLNFLYVIQILQCTVKFCQQHFHWLITSSSGYDLKSASVRC
jgi:hypothetical protein